MKFNLFKKLFGKKEEVNIESGATSGVVIPQEPEAPVAEDDAWDVVETGPGFVYPENFVVLLDNGHAKSTPGKRSPKLDDGSQFFEYEFNRDIVKRIAKGLDEVGIKYHILVPEVEEDIDLTTRAKRANAFCKQYGKENCMLISVHSNAYGKGDKWEDPGRWSVWTTVGVTKSDEYGKVLYETAEEMLEPYGFGCRNGKVQGNGNAGPDYEENFTVIYKARCPAILTENLFFTNKKECEWLMTDTGRKVIADIHIEGIKKIAEKH